MNNNQYMDPRNPYQAQGMPRRPGDNRSNPGVIVLIVLIVLLLLLAVVGGFVAFKIFKDRMTTNVDVSSLIRVKTSAVKKKDISVSADDLLNAAGVSSAKSNYADMQQAAQSFVQCFPVGGCSYGGSWRQFRQRKVR